jgi:hypothetical protein
MAIKKKATPSSVFFKNKYKHKRKIKIAVPLNGK